MVVVLGQSWVQCTTCSNIKYNTTESNVLVLSPSNANDYGKRHIIWNSYGMWMCSHCVQQSRNTTTQRRDFYNARDVQHPGGPSYIANATEWIQLEAPSPGQPIPCTYVIFTPRTHCLTVPCVVTKRCPKKLREFVPDKPHVGECIYDANGCHQ